MGYIAYWKRGYGLKGKNLEIKWDSISNFCSLLLVQSPLLLKISGCKVLIGVLNTSVQTGETCNGVIYPLVRYGKKEVYIVLKLNIY